MERLNQTLRSLVNQYLKEEAPENKEGKTSEKDKNDFLSFKKNKSKASIQEVLSSILDFSDIKTNWTSIVGKTLATHSTPLKISKKKLFVACYHSISAEMIRSQKKIILEKLFKQLPHFSNRIYEITVDLKAVYSQGKMSPLFKPPEPPPRPRVLPSNCPEVKSAKEKINSFWEENYSANKTLEEFGPLLKIFFLQNELAEEFRKNPNFLRQRARLLDEQ